MAPREPPRTSSRSEATSPASSEAAAAGAPRRLHLVDGSGYIFRAYHALPPLSRSDGVPTGAVAGFCNMLVKLLDDVRDEGANGHLAVIFDAGRRTFRNDIYPEYKANRPEPPEDLVPQFALIREATRAFNVPCIELAGFEADDLIATYARHAVEVGYEVVIVSSDKDLMQLVRDGVSMLDPMRARRIGPAEVEERFGVAPDKVVDVQALAGDSVDNVPGVPGIGVKTAAELIRTYGDLDSLLARAAEIKQPKRRDRLIAHAEDARMSRELVRLRDDVPVVDGVETLETRPPEPDTLFQFLDTMGFAALAARLKSRHGVGDAAVPARAAAPPGTAGYRCVQTLDELGTWIAEATYQGIVAVDTETTSLDALQADLVGVSLATAAGRACYIPLGHQAAGDQEGSSAPEQIPFDAALALLKPLLEDPAVLKIGQNIKYDMVVLERYGLAVAPVDDTMLLSFVLDAGLRTHGMDTLAERHLGHRTISYKEVAGSGKAQVSFDKVPLETAVAYAAEDADVTWQLCEVLKPRLVAERLVSVYETLERPLIPVLAQMELAGIRVDPNMLAELSRDFAARADELEADIHKLAGHSFNVGSPKQLGEILFDEMALPGGKKGKTDAYATGADVLETLAAPGPRPAPARARLAPAHQAQEHLYRLVAGPGQSGYRAGAHVLCDGGRGDRAARLERPQPPEHPGAHRGGAQDSPRLHRRARLQARLGRLLADRASHPRPHRRDRAVAPSLLRRPRRPCADREPGVRCSARGHGPDGPALGQGDQLRHHLRHQRVRLGAPVGHPAR